ncbi:decapping and exoribonuclease protein [Nephila pilipes]|uniref:Decapping nuclease n=1 Tax=Nephila pilipes TaxID=299642 RepID=A0A8X6QBS1_NEPPI|nr:decapping and exoribonuclease protein [Nephila pilipes]
MTTIYFSSLNSEEIDLLESPFDPYESTDTPLFGKPKEIGHFSIDSERRIHFDRSQMKYLISPLKMKNIHLNLDANFSSDIFHEYVTLEKMYQTLHWLKHHQQILKTNLPKTSTKKSNIDFISVRGALALIMCTPYLSSSLHNQWEICATKFNGIIYFTAIDTDVDIAENKNASIRQMKYQSWGYKFEQYLTTDSIEGSPDLSSKTHQLEEFCVILKNVLNDHTLLYKAEIDAVIPHRQPTPGFGDTSCYTELKTSKNINTIIDEYNFNRYKALHWWAQSCLAGNLEIICGKRTNDGIVRSIDIYRVNNLPQHAQGMWSADVCLNFCNKFLNFLKRVVIEDDYNVVYKFSYKSGDMIYCTKLINPELRYRVIPQWYKENYG